VMCDHILMTEGSGYFWRDRALVQARDRQTTSRRDLGAKMARAIAARWISASRMMNACMLRGIRALVAKSAAGTPRQFSHVNPARTAVFRRRYLSELFSSDPGKQYDLR